MAKKCSVISAGAFFDALKAEYEKSNSTEKLFVRANGTEKKTLDKSEAISVFRKIKKTVLDVFAVAGLPFILSREERTILSAVEGMNEAQLQHVAACIHRMCDPWWTEILEIGEDENCSSITRFKQFALHKYPASAEKDFEAYPYLNSIYPFRLVTKIPTDNFPQLCMESGMPLSFLMDLPISEVHFYSTNPNVDRVYTEYRLIYSEEIRGIVARMILKS